MNQLFESSQMTQDNRHAQQLLKQNQQLSLQVYQLNNQVLKKQGEL